MPWSSAYAIQAQAAQASGTAAVTVATAHRPRHRGTKKEAGGATPARHDERARAASALRHINVSAPGPSFHRLHTASWSDVIPGDPPSADGVQRVLATAASVATPEGESARPGRGQMLMPLYATLGMTPLLRNLLCSVDRLDVPLGRMVIAMDPPPLEGASQGRVRTTCQVARSPFGLSRVLPCEAPYGRAGDDGAARNGSSGGGAAPHRASKGALDLSQQSRYLSRGFNTIMLHRVAWMQLLLSRGLTILHCDLDVVWLHDPMTRLLGAARTRRPTCW